MALPITPPSCFIIQPKRHRGSIHPPHAPLFISFISQMAVVWKFASSYLASSRKILTLLYKTVADVFAQMSALTHTHTHTDTLTWRWIHTHTHTYKQREYLYRTTYGARATFVFKFQCLWQHTQPEEGREKKSQKEKGRDENQHLHYAHTHTQTQGCYLCLKEGQHA